MRKLVGIIVDSVAPNDPNVLWVNKDGLYISEGGKWIEINGEFFDAISEDMQSMYTAINADNTGILDRLSTAENSISTLENQFDDTDENSAISRIAALEEAVFTEETEPEQNPGSEIE